jgi:hypothetical protein
VPDGKNDGLDDTDDFSTFRFNQSVKEFLRFSKIPGFPTPASLRLNRILWSNYFRKRGIKV